MAPRLPLRVALAVVLALAHGPSLAARVDSDLAAAQNGGGCHPAALNPALLDMLTLVNPEWAPVVGGAAIDSEPVLVHGVVEEMHGDTSGDFPSTHVRADVVHVVRLDEEDADRLGTGNEGDEFQFEWEAGFYPAWAWAGTGDRLVGLGRWIFDCGHPGPIPGNCSATTARPCAIDADCRPPICPACGEMEACIGAHYAYSTELHPPQATAAIRTGRGAIVSEEDGAKPVPATRADIFIGNEAGGAGDRCILAHQANDLDLLSVECFPLSEPVAPINANDFVFDVPLPPRPPGGRRALWRLVTYDPPGGAAARIKVRRHLRAPDPHLRVVVRMTRKKNGSLPTGFAGTLFAGWKGDPSPLVHVRLTIDEVVVRNALQPARATAPRTCGTTDVPCTTNADCPAGQACQGTARVKSWRLQAAVNGEWQELGGLESIDTGDVIAEGLVYDQYLAPGGTLHLEANGRSQECIDSMYGKSLATDLAVLGFGKGIGCLASEARNPGQIDLAYPGPDFGAGTSGTMAYETVSTGGVGGHCSTSADLLCTVDADCPSGETCATTGGAFGLRYRIERLS